jgi:hypothetical protein
MTRRFPALAAATVAAAGVLFPNPAPASAQVGDALGELSAKPTTAPRKASGSVDFPLFARACRPYIAASYQSTSDVKFQVSGASAEQKAIFSAKISVVSGSGGKYRSDIAFTKPDGNTGSTFRLIHDGTNVNIANNTAREYAVLDPETFQASSDSFLAVGFFGSLMRGEFSALAKLFDDPEVQKADPAEIEEGIRKGLREKGGEIAQESETIGGTEMTVFVLTMPAGKFRFAVDPDSGRMRRVTMNATSEDGMKITITEDITTIKTPATLQGDTFRFTAPSGSRKVEKVDISPFN